ncbi:MAG: S1 RNA-binding domain-containing protein, partial [Clostridia bacterium]|nr:S1 RNA-binding domain-containing protein [Clostridia bacterium]
KTDITKNVELMSKELGIGELTLSDIIREIEKPGRDPRDSMPPVVFRNDVLSFDDLEPGMELSGTVRNVVDFGAFVDIGVKTDGLVHVSHLSKKFVSNPFDVVSVGDNVKVRILEIDREKNKISLTMNF